MEFQVTVRYGHARQRYHLFTVDAGEIGEALEAAAEGLPDDVAREGTLAEIRLAVDPEARRYVEAEETGTGQPSGSDEPEAPTPA